MTRTPPKYMSPGRLQKFREEQASKRAARAAGRGGKKSAPKGKAKKSAPRSLTLSSEHTADAAQVAELLTREGTTSILGSSFGSTGFSSFKAQAQGLGADNLDEAMMQGRRDVLFPSTSREAARTGTTSTTSAAQRSLRAVSENLKRNSFAVVKVKGGNAGNAGKAGKAGKAGNAGKGGSAGGRLQGKRRKFVPLRKVRNPKRVEAVVIGSMGSSGSGGGGGGGGGVYLSPDSEAVRVLSQVARSPLPPKPARQGTPLQRAKALEKAVRRMVRSLRPKNKRCPRGTRRGFGSRCYSPTMLKLLNRVRAQIKVLRAHEKNMAMLRKMRKGRTLAASVKRSLAKTYGARVVRRIAARKMTLPRGAKLVRIPVRKVKGKSVYKYRLRR